MYERLLVRYGEISLKGRNRSKFEDLLISNIRYALKDLPYGKIEKTFGRIYIEVRGDWEALVPPLSRVFGIVSLSPVTKCALTLDDIKACALGELLRDPKDTFKVETRRPNKRFPLTTPEINNEVGGHLLTHTEGIAVHVHHPETTIHIEVRDEGALIYSRNIKTLGGLPLGTSGKGLLLLSGGLDSPVAGFLSMKRGVVVEGLYFHSPPFTSERAQDKVVELAKILSRFNLQGQFRLWIGYFTEIQKALQSNPFPNLKVTIMRRMMLRIADKLARREKAMALITGDSLGQVASQTIESIHVINAVTNLPVFRPLISMDKQEIVDIALKIDTYETSILPYEDCCTVFLPKNPATRPSLRQVAAAESHLDIEGLLEEALEKTEFLEI